MPVPVPVPTRGVPLTRTTEVPTCAAVRAPPPSRRRPRPSVSGIQELVSLTIRQSMSYAAATSSHEVRPGKCSTTWSRDAPSWYRPVSIHRSPDAPPQYVVAVELELDVLLDHD